MAKPEQSHPFYKPLWRRVAILAAVAGWLAYEVLVTRNTLWMTLAAGMLAYAAWVFFISWPREPKEPQA
jgi:hypothetical protein